jgi:hypothetical protein
MAALDHVVATEWRANMEVQHLMEHWRSQPTPQLPVIAFHGHTQGQFRCFSNFYESDFTTFRIPDCCWSEEFGALYSQTVSDVAFSEKSIMLCKAALFRDHEAFEHIQVIYYLQLFLCFE